MSRDPPFPSPFVEPTRFPHPKGLSPRHHSPIPINGPDLSIPCRTGYKYLTFQAGALPLTRFILFCELGIRYIRSVAVSVNNSKLDGPPAEVPEAPKVTRSIMIKRPAGCPSPGQNGTPPALPAGSTPPVSPFAGGGGGKEWNRFRRKSSSDCERPAGVVGAGPRSPPPPHEV